MHNDAYSSIPNGLGKFICVISSQSFCSVYYFDIPLRSYSFSLFLQNNFNYFCCQTKDNAKCQLKSNERISCSISCIISTSFYSLFILLIYSFFRYLCNLLIPVIDGKQKKRNNSIDYLEHSLNRANMALQLMQGSSLVHYSYYYRDDSDVANESNDVLEENFDRIGFNGCNFCCFYSFCTSCHSEQYLTLRLSNFIIKSSLISCDISNSSNSSSNDSNKDQIIVTIHGLACESLFLSAFFKADSM